MSNEALKKEAIKLRKQKMGLQEIADKIHKSLFFVHNAVRHLNIKKESIQGNKKLIKKVITLRKTKNINQIASELSVSEGSVNSILNKVDPNLRKKQIKQPKILLFDIETAPIVAHVWGLFDQNVGLNQIEKDWHLLSWSAKWLGSDEVMYADQRGKRNISDDKAILKKLWKLVDEADIVITQNGISFDMKKLNARFIINGMAPPSSVKHIDTLRIARRMFGFTSNKLEYLSNKLNVKFKKLTHGTFPGHEMWKQCLKDNIKAWQEMEEYNKHDVLALEELYLKMQPWDNKVDLSKYMEVEGMLCNCGSTKFKKHGFTVSGKNKYRRLICTKCGAERKGDKI